MQADRITAGIVLSCLLAEDDKTSVFAFFGFRGTDLLFTNGVSAYAITLLT